MKPHHLRPVDPQVAFPQRKIDELVPINIQDADGVWPIHLSWMTVHHLELNPKMVYKLAEGDFKIIADVNQAAADTVHAFVRAMLHVRCMSRLGGSRGTRQPT